MNTLAKKNQGTATATPPAATQPPAQARPKVDTKYQIVHEFQRHASELSQLLGSLSPLLVSLSNAAVRVRALKVEEFPDEKQFKQAVENATAVEGHAKKGVLAQIKAIQEEVDKVTDVVTKL